MTLKYELDVGVFISACHPDILSSSSNACVCIWTPKVKVVERDDSALKRAMQRFAYTPPGRSWIPFVLAAYVVRSSSEKTAS